MTNEPMTRCNYPKVIMTSSMARLPLFLLSLYLQTCLIRSFNMEKLPNHPSASPMIPTSYRNSHRWIVANNVIDVQQPDFLLETTPSTRRTLFTSIHTASTMILTSSLSTPARADTRSTADATITDKIFIEFNGIPKTSDMADTSSNRIVIGLFGNDAPQPVSILKQLVSKEGYMSKCKPLDTSRLLQKDQLEANKVYNSCLESEESVGVNYNYSSVWRIVHDQRIDIGAVSGKFIARENPKFEKSNNSAFSHDMPGVVSVREGSEGGYGFTIFPGQRGDWDASLLDEDNIVVGRVIEGMDVVQRLNEMPVVKSASVNYMALTGGQNSKNSPSRACRYGGPMYCNENKPLKKILIEKTGIL